jgi:uncharacterized protein (TIGR02611 family)
MPGKIQKDWQSLKKSRPGHRFQERYERRQRERSGPFDPGRVLYIVVGLVLAVGSAVFGVLPGPGTLTFLLGLALIAGEFRPAARLLDWAEVRVRQFVRWFKRVWRGASPAGKALISLFILALALTLAYAGYRLLFG